MLSRSFCIILLSVLSAANSEQSFQNSVKEINGSVSEACLNQMKFVYDGLINQELWALKMADANAKFPTGILSGNFYDLGNFDECLGVRNNGIIGKYCLGTFPIPNINTKKVSLGTTKGGQPRILEDRLYFHSAACIPNKCTAEDITNIFFLRTFDEKYCYTEEDQSVFTSGAIATIAILGIFLAVVVLSTSYDVYLYYKRYKPGNEVTIAFSYFSNGKKLLTSTRNSDQLLCLNGMKAISMMWIVMAHEYVNGASAPIANYLSIFNFIQETANMFIIGATVAVDTFFVIGGLVTVYTFLKATDKGVKFNLFIYYLHRYIRLTPALAIVVLIHATLLKYLGNGPLWNSFDDHLVEPCRKHWWAALLYIQNYVHDDQACVPQSWYLSIDMQLFVLSPIVLLLLKRKPKWTLVGLVILNFVGIIVPFVIAFSKELTAFMLANKDDTVRYMFFYYEQTYGRFGAYVIGMILGYFIYKIKKGDLTLKLKKLTVALLWTACLSGGLACVYAGHDTMLAPYDKWAHSLYIAFNRPAWSLAISGIIFLCVTGYGGPVNNFLSAPIFQFLSKISYSIYLVHYELILLRAASYKTEIMIEHFYVFFNFWGDFMFSIGLALVLCLTFESPMITIEKILFNKCFETSRSKLNV